jgi:hypothetical protein
MKLLSVGLSEYKRFAGDAGNLDVSGNPIAVVGPNEVGKTSFLRALEHLNEPGGFLQTERTHGGDGSTEVRAVFALDAKDKADIAALGGVGAPTIFKLWNRGGDQMTAALEPRVMRDRGPRERARGAVVRLLKTKWVEDLGEDPIVELLTNLSEQLASGSETIESEGLDRLNEASQALREHESPSKSALKLSDDLVALVSHESIEHPDDTARNLMYDRRPIFLWFDENRRQIESAFSLDEAPSPALQDLFTLIGFDLSELEQATANGDRPRVAELTNEAREKFRTFFQGRWRQARVRLELDVEGRGVHVFVTNTQGNLIPIAERSEGLRQFIALMAFVEREAAGRDAVVLVDEAEQHLHYDAQADLVRVFSGEIPAEKIIYTTHSAGCLPHDLGMGVRIIEAVGPEGLTPDEWEHSQLRNWFWDKGPGYSPLLMAMGASTFAFTSTRKAIVAEGISDALLLPTLFREALDATSLDIQVAPGLSNVNERTVKELDFVASRVVFLVDGDPAGVEKRDELIEAGVPANRILLLGLGRRELTLEDLIAKPLYVDAVNKELQLRQRPVIPAGEIPALRRKHAVEQWCEANLPRGKEDAPSERAVAHHLLERLQEARLAPDADELQLLDPKFVKTLTTVFERAEGLLGAPSYAPIEKADE